LPVAVAPNRSIQGEPGFKRGNRRLRAALVQKAERRVENEQHPDDRSFDIFGEHQLKRDRGFKEARHSRNKFAGDKPQEAPPAWHSAQNRAACAAPRRW
jgi:hypothetical protein